MKVVAYTDDAGRPAIGVRLEEGVLPSGHTDLAAMIKAGPRELDRLRHASESPHQMVSPTRLRVPIAPASTLVLAGANYAAHLAHTDREAEVSIIISKPAYRVPAERAHEYIFGYTMINDVSARDVMDREPLQ